MPVQQRMRPALAEGQARVPLVMSMPEIAELAGVHRPVVTTWRRRHRDFPAPVGGDTSRPLFDPRQVADWLIGTGRADRGTIEPDLSMYTLASLGAKLPARDLIATVTALICLRHLDDDEPLADGTDDIAGAIGNRAARTDPGDELFLSELGRLAADSSWLAAAVDDLVEASWGCRGAFERIMSARNRFKAADLYSDAVTPELARLIAEVSGARERARRSDSFIVSDLAAGSGDLLTAVVGLIDDGVAPMFIAAEPDSYLARLVRRRLIVHGIPLVDQDIQTEADLSDDPAEPDVIVTQIPYVPGEDRSSAEVLKRIDDIALRLGLGCCAVVLGPADALAGALPRYGEAERARLRLLQDGVVEAIVRLPGGLVPFRPGYQTALWVLTRTRESRWPGRVLLADVSDRDLTDDVASAVAEDVITWRRDGYQPGAHTRAFGVQVSINELVSSPGALTARRPSSVRESEIAGPARVARVNQLEAELNRVSAYATAQRRPVRSGLSAGTARRPTATTIGTLVRAGRLSVLKGTRVDVAHVGIDGHHMLLGSPEVLGECRPGHRKIDRELLATRYPRAKLTEPGDVVVTTIPRLGAIVDHAGFCVVEFPARILRIPRSEHDQFTSRVLAALLTAEGAGARPASAVRPVLRLEERRLALPSPAEVALLDTLLAELDERSGVAQREIDMLDELRDVATAGLIDGTLTLAGDNT
jgi:hypothetical protein